MFRGNENLDEFLQECGTLVLKTYVHVCCLQQHKLAITSIFSSLMALSC